MTDPQLSPPGPRKRRTSAASMHRSVNAHRQRPAHRVQRDIASRTPQYRRFFSRLLARRHRIVLRYIYLFSLSLLHPRERKAIQDQGDLRTTKLLYYFFSRCSNSWCPSPRAHLSRDVKSSRAPASVAMASRSRHLSASWYPASTLNARLES